MAVELEPHVTRIARDRQLGDLLWSRPLTKPDKGYSDRSLVKSANAVHVFEHGCVLGHDAEESSHPFRWDEVISFNKKIVEHSVRTSSLRLEYDDESTQYDFTFKLPGRTLMLTGRSTEKRDSVLKGFSELVSPLVARAQVPGMLAALGRGEVIEFGSLKVAPTGLSKPAWRKKNQNLAWKDLRDFAVVRGSLRIRSHNDGLVDWFDTAVGDVPNLDALLHVLETCPTSGGA
jgi:hypothetical protein